MALTETKRIAWSAASPNPIDLAADPDVGISAQTIDAPRQNVAYVAVQNVSTRIVRFAEQPTAPAADATDVGHVLSPGAGVVLQMLFGRPCWLWSPGSGEVAVSRGAPAPTYDAPAEF